MKNKHKKLLTKLKNFKFVTILVLEFQKIENNDETKFITFYCNSKAGTIISKKDTNGNFEYL